MSEIKHTMTDVRKGVIQGTEIQVKYVSWDTYTSLEQNMASMQETNHVLISKCHELAEALEDILTSLKLLPDCQKLKCEIDFAQQALNKAKGLANG